jgi:hypothetical protein
MDYSLAEVQMAAMPLPMFYAATGNRRYAPTRCPVLAVRNQGHAPRSSNNGVFVPPDKVTVTSSFGGSFTADQSNGIIQLR